MTPTFTPLSGVDFSKRYASGETEKSKYLIRSFFNLRNLLFKLFKYTDNDLPFNKPDALLKENDSVDLSKFAVKVIIKLLVDDIISYLLIQ